MSSAFLLTNGAVRAAVYFFSSIGVAIGLGHVTTLNVDQFEGARGITAFAVTVYAFAAIVLGLIFFEIYQRKSLTEAVLKRFHLALMGLALPGFVAGFVPLAYQVYKYEIRSVMFHAVDEREKKAFVEKTNKELAIDWNRGIWHNGSPKCIEFAEKGITSICPATVAVKYCWRMAKDQDWGTHHTDCDGGKSTWVVLQPGFNAYEPRPWCRSYQGQCYAESVVSCAVAAYDLSIAKTKCESLQVKP